MPLIYNVNFDSIHIDIDAKRLAKATMGVGGGRGVPLKTFPISIMLLCLMIKSGFFFHQKFRSLC